MVHRMIIPTTYATQICHERFSRSRGAIMRRHTLVGEPVYLTFYQTRSLSTLVKEMYAERKKAYPQMVEGGAPTGYFAFSDPGLSIDVAPDMPDCYFVTISPDGTINAKSGTTHGELSGPPPQGYDAKPLWRDGPYPSVDLKLSQLITIMKLWPTAQHKVRIAVATEDENSNENLNYILGLKNSNGKLTTYLVSNDGHYFPTHFPYRCPYRQLVARGVTAHS